MMMRTEDPTTQVLIPYPYTQSTVQGRDADCSAIMTMPSQLVFQRRRKMKMSIVGRTVERANLHARLTLNNCNWQEHVAQKVY